MLEIEEARVKITEAVSTISETEDIPLAKGLNRILDANIISQIDVPPADNSAMDGYAFRFQDLGNKTQHYSVSQRITAGAKATALDPGTSARIFTGAELPENADTVVMQENCEIESDGRVSVISPIKFGENVRAQGQDIKVGETVLKKGQRLDPQHIGLAASIGLATITVKRRPTVAIFSTGNELVAPGQALEKGQIYNSNQFMLLALLEKLGCTCIDLGHIEDNLDTTQSLINTAAAQSDLIISSGGVSVGDEDYVKHAVQTLGELQLWKINIKPGKPLAFGKIGHTSFLGLPGNPVSAYVTFLLFGIPLIKKLSGNLAPAPQATYLPANFDVAKVTKRPEYVRVRIKKQGVDTYPNQSSGVLSSVCWADALALIPSHTVIRRGDLLAVYPLERFF